ncbi:MAG TPA: hypothetical protein VFY16_12895 [Gemmatimonadaceae bacterium]|nr:hypothetical protein [Gemmatimonadaceae bacterium]
MLPAPERAGAACTPNIDPSGRRRRAMLGIVALAGAALAATWLLARGAAPAAALPLAIPLFVGLLGLLQARASTCVAFAARGLRAEGGSVTPLSADELGPVRRQARRVTRDATAGTLLLTLLFVALLAVTR